MRDLRTHIHRIACCVALAVMAAVPAAADAAADITSFTLTPTKNVRTPDPSRAGSHPDLLLGFKSATTNPPQPGDGSLKTLRMEFPAGLALNPRAVPYCPTETYLNQGNCPAAGLLGIGAVFGGGGGFKLELFPLKPRKGEAGRIGMKSNAGVQAGQMVASVTPSNGYRIRTEILEMTRELTYISEVKNVFIYGTPADGAFNKTGPPRAAVTYTPSCATDMTTSLSADSYEVPGVFDTITTVLPTPTDCASVPFTPGIDVEPESHQPGAPSGYTVDLTVPQTFDPDELGQAHLKDAVVTLPEGVTLNPAAADGLAACSDEQLGLHSDAAATCPAASKIGTVAIESLLLDEPLEGSIYVGSQVPGDPYRIFLALGEDKLLIKLQGSVRPDPQTGRLTTTFEDNPQLPFSKMSLKFKGGPRAPLANPTTCGEKTVTSVLTPWSGNAAAEPSDTFSIDCPAPAGFTPAFNAGMISPVGGAFSPFALRIDRDDADQMLGGLSMDLPTGLLAKIQGVAQCPEAQAAAGTCGQDSRVGTATVGAGAGSNPFFLNGPVYLTEGYKGAPFGLSVVVRALAGPYDLGTVVVRQALHVDPDDAHAKVVSDPFPTILEGVPLRLRSINVDMDRPGFMVNPTSCAPKQITGRLTSTGGAEADVAKAFRATSCSALPFKPKLALRLVGKSQRAPGKHPGLRAVLTQPTGQANMKQVKVKLPSSLALDPENADGLCSYEGGLEANCPESSKIGTATAISPLVNRPLSGSVYFVQGVRFDKDTGARIRTQPTLLVKLRGEIAIDLRATTSVSGKKLVTTFPAIPDAPVSKFSMALRSGDGGILAVTGRRNLCSAPRGAVVETDGQNGRRSDYVAKIKAPCPRR